MPLDESLRIQHLLRRAGFGGTPAEVEEYRRLGYRAAVDRLVDYEQVPADTWAGLETFDQTVPSPPFERPRQLGVVRTWWMNRAVESTRPLQEKMVWFWMNWLTTAAGKVDEPVMILWQNQFFREHALSDLRTILRGISRDPAMLRYLDNNVNRRQSPNENYARELFELYSLGVGNYTELDIRESARAFTGWTYDQQGRFLVRPNQHDNGQKTIFGRTGNWDGDDVIDMIMAHPAMPDFVARKVWTFFVHPSPTEADLQPVKEAFVRSDYSMREAVRAALLSPAFDSERSWRQRMKDPFQLVIGTWRQMGQPLPPNGFGAMVRMGQNPMEPPMPDGWDQEEAWMTTSTWLERVNYANTVANTQNLDVAALLPSGLDTHPGTAVTALAWRFVDGRLSPAARSTLLAHAGDGRLDEVRLRGLLYLLLASPEYQLA